MPRLRPTVPDQSVPIAGQALMGGGEMSSMNQVDGRLTGRVFSTKTIATSPSRDARAQKSARDGRRRASSNMRGVRGWGLVSALDHHGRPGGRWEDRAAMEHGTPRRDCERRAGPLGAGWGYRLMQHPYFSKYSRGLDFSMVVWAHFRLGSTKKSFVEPQPGSPRG